MIYATDIPKKRRKHALRDVCAVESVAPKFNPWLAYLITFDRRDHPTSIRHEGSAALVLDPIIDGYHLTRVLMDGGSSLNLIYQDTVRRMGIDPSRISQSNTTFEGVIPGVEAHCKGSLVLEVTFGSPGNSRSEELLFTIAPSKAAIMHCLGERPSPASTQYHTMPTLNSRCPAHVASSPSTEIQSVPYARKSMRQL